MRKEETKYPTLIEQFVREELTVDVRQLLKEALAREPEGAKLRSEFQFNRFNVVLDFERMIAVVEDDLDVSPAGTAEIQTGTFKQNSEILRQGL